MSQILTVNHDDDCPSWITGNALDRHFSMQEALFEFSRLFRDEKNDRALAIVGGAFLDTLLENILIEFWSMTRMRSVSCCDMMGRWERTAGGSGWRTASACCARQSATT